MSAKISIRFFDDREVRAVWDEQNAKWWFSVLDIVAVLTNQDDYTKTRNYFRLWPHAPSFARESRSSGFSDLSFFLYFQYCDYLFWLFSEYWIPSSLRLGLSFLASLSFFTI